MNSNLIELPYLDYIWKLENYQELMFNEIYHATATEYFEKFNNQIRQCPQIPTVLFEKFFINDKYRKYSSVFFTYFSKLSDGVIQWIFHDDETFSNQLMKQFQDFIYELYKSEIKITAEIPPFESINDFFKHYMARREQCNLSLVRESIENFIVVGSFFQNKTLYYNLNMDLLSQMEDQRSKFIILVMEDECSDDVFSSIDLKNPTHKQVIFYGLF